MSGFSFGGPSTSAPSSTGGFSFGSTSSAPSTATGGFNFGSTGGSSSSAPSSSTGGFNFGSSSTTTQPSTTSSGFNFGSAPSSSQQPSSTTSSGFNFGTSSTQPSTTSSGFNFGSSSTLQPTSSSSGGYGFGSTMMPMMSSTNAPPSIIEATLQSISSKYNPNSNDCAFTYFFYNVVEESKVQQTLAGLRQKYPMVPERQWRDAIQANPEPKKFVPVPARSFDDLTARVEQQKSRQAMLNNGLAVVERNLNTIQRNHEIKTLKQIEDVKQKHTVLSERILKVMTRIEVQMQKGIGMRNDDIQLKNKLNALMMQLHKPDQFRGRLNEINPQFHYYLQNSGSLLALSDNVTSDEDSINDLTQFLKLQNNGISQLVEVVQKDLVDVDKIKQSIQERNHLIQKSRYGL